MEAKIISTQIIPTRMEKIKANGIQSDIDLIISAKRTALEEANDNYQFYMSINDPEKAEEEKARCQLLQRQINYLTHN